ncbi:unnamed protein product [Mytilus coruscus]|uniref:Endonuclease/exonuclease/phosphatase domain-containing protein n=1 Tax=Mytilus coruscus TaxID=42192 RepID=A0A6J8AG74_MYTCO|nr:unnamed protein product [Mytilus coruscus]
MLPREYWPVFCAAHTVKKGKRLSFLDIICISLFAKYDIRMLPVTILLHFVFHQVDTRSIISQQVEKCDARISKCTHDRLHDHCDLIISCSFSIVCILLLISGIEPNPGSLTAESRSSSNSSLDDVFKNAVSFMHLNIQSIVPKLELIAAEYSCHEILSFTESWLSSQVSNEAILLPGYKTPFRRDRVGKAGGGVIVYVKDNLNCIEVRFKTKKYLYGTFYVPPNSSPQVWDNIEQSIDLALSCNLDIIVTGDFNTNQLRNTTNDRISMIKAQFSLHQLISDPTYITEHSSSLLDLILVNDPVNLLFSDIGAPLLDQIRYHAPVIGILTQPYKLHQVFKRKIYMYDRGDYDSYRHQLSLVDWDALFITNDVDAIARAITDELIDKANKKHSNRIITVRKDIPPWLTADIKRMIRKKIVSTKEPKNKFTRTGQNFDYLGINVIN